MLRLQAFAVFVLFTLLSGGVLAAGDNSSDSLWVGKIVYGSPLDIMSACDIQAEVVLLNYAQCPTQCNGAITVKGIGGTAPYTYRWADNLIAGASRIGMCPATPYWLTITDAAGCSKEFRFQIQTNGTNCNLCPFTITGFTTNPASCPDATDGSATVNTSLPGAYTYQWESFSGSTPSGLTTRTISNAPPGDYKVKVTSSGLLGCSRTAALTVSKKSQSCLPDGNCLKVSVSSSDESCVGACDGQINLQIAGGSGDYVSLWTTGAYSENSEYISGGLCEGDYTVTIVDRGLLNSIPLNPIDLLTYVTQLSNNTCIVKRITTHISAGTQACSEDKKCFHSTDPHLHAADNCYCSLNVAVLTSPASCINSGDGLARITAKGPKAPYQFRWSTGARGPIAYLNPGTYTVDIYDRLNVKVSTATFSVGNRCPSSNCEGCATTVNSLIYNTLLGIVGPVLSSPAFPIPQLSTASNCEYSLKFQYTTPTIPGLNDGAIYVGFDYLSPAPYQWTDGFSGASRTDLGPGNYQGSHEIVAGCVPKFGADIKLTCTEAPLPKDCKTVVDYSVTEVGQDPQECGKRISVTATGGYGSFEYYWSEPSFGNNQNPEHVCPGNYILTIRTIDPVTGDYCDTEVQVVVPAVACNLQGHTTDQGVYCPGSCDGEINVRVSGGTEPYSITWSDGNTTDFNRRTFCTGAVSYTVVDANGCKYSDQRTIEQLNSVCCTPVEVKGVDHLCQPSNVSLGASGGKYYEWTPAHLFNDDNRYSSDPVIFVDYSTEINVKVYRPGCPDEQFSYYIEMLTPDFGTITPAEQTVCVATTSIQLKALPYPEYEADIVKYEWSHGTGVGCITCKESTATLKTGINVFTVKLTDKNGCTQHLYSTITQLPMPNNLNTELLYCNSPDQLVYIKGDLSNAYGNTNMSKVFYSVTGIPGVPDGNVTATEGGIVVPPPPVNGSYAVRAIVRDELGCIYVNFIDVKNTVPPIINITYDPPACDQETLELNATLDQPGFELRWVPADNLSCSTCPNPTLALGGGILSYALIAKKAECVADKAIGITYGEDSFQDMVDKLDIIVQDNNCAYRFEASPAGFLNYNWSFGDNSGPFNERIKETHFYGNGGYYTVRVEVETPCATYTSSKIIDVVLEGCNCHE